MAISAQRFKFLDKETNVATTDFYELTDNKVYNAFEEAMASSIESIRESDGLLNSINGSMSELSDMVTSNTESAVSDIKSALNMAIDSISKMELPGIVKDIFNKLKELDLDGVKSFVKDLLNVGGIMLCNNTEFLKLFTLGYALNKNILGGLLTALLFSWLDRFCASYSKTEMPKLNGLQKLEKVIPATGVLVDKSNIFKTFTNNYADYVNYKAPLDISTPLSVVSFIENSKSGDISYGLDNLRSSEISYSDKREYLQAIDLSLGSYPSTSPEYSNLLNTRAGLLSLPLISEKRIDKNNKYSNLSDRLGSMSTNLIGVDLSTSEAYNFNSIERGLSDKIKSYQKDVAGNPSIATRNNNSTSYDDFEFENVLPELTTEELAYVNNAGGSDRAHRVHDMHPTTSVFLENA